MLVLQYTGIITLHVFVLYVSCYAFGINEKLLTQHISGLLTARAWVSVRARAKG